MLSHFADIKARYDIAFVAQITQSTNASLSQTVESLSPSPFLFYTRSFYSLLFERLKMSAKIRLLSHREA